MFASTACLRGGLSLFGLPAAACGWGWLGACWVGVGVGGCAGGGGGGGLMASITGRRNGSRTPVCQTVWGN